MSEGNVAVLNTKLDILIDDFKSFKKYALGFLMALAIPFAVFVTMSITKSNTDIAVIQEKLHTNPETKDSADGTIQK